MAYPDHFHLEWYITQRCNLKCRHCCFDSRHMRDELPKRTLFLILDKFIKLVEKWNLKKNNARISITGGEPLIRDDFFRLLERCYNYRHKVNYGVLTNGILLTKDSIKKLKDLKVSYIQISLDGMEAANDSIRGKGTFKEIIKRVRWLADEKIPVVVSMCAIQENVKDVPKVIKLCQALKVAKLAIRDPVPIGQGKKIRSKMLQPDEVRQLYVYIAKTKDKLQKKKNSLELKLGCEDGILAQENRYPVKGCNSGYGSLAILPNGDVYPCERLPIYIGNILKESFEAIYYSEKLQELRNLNNTNKECQKCPYFSKCLGGSKCMAYAFFNNPFAPDPRCWRLFKNLPKNEFLTGKDKIILNE